MNVNNDPVIIHDIDDQIYIYIYRYLDIFRYINDIGDI